MYPGVSITVLMVNMISAKLIANECRAIAGMGEANTGHDLPSSKAVFSVPRPPLQVRACQRAARVQHRRPR
jgi:hypothetical protein